MDIIREITGWIFFEQLLIFLIMVAIVMTVGPWWLRKQTLRLARYPMRLGGRLWISFIAGLASIILFYALFFCFGALMGWIADALYSKGIFIAVIILFLVVFFGSYFACLHGIVIFLIKQRIKRRTKRRMGWHLTLMCGVCTIFMFYSIMSKAMAVSMKAVYTTNLNGIVKSMELYEGKYNVYPTDLGDLVNEGYASPRMFKTYESDVNNVNENEKFKAPPYVHCNSLRNDAPGDVLWIWFDPDQYDSQNMPVAYRSGGIDIIDKKELPALIERSRKWLADHPEDATPLRNKGQ